MKILWLSNNPCYAIQKLSPNTASGGWLKALNYHMVEHEDIDLNVCFYWPETIASFEFHNTRYFPISPTETNSLTDSIKSRISGGIVNDQRDIDNIKTVVEEVDPDLIHVHGTELNLGLIQFETSVPVVISIQGVLSPYLEKYYSGVPEKILKKFKSTGFLPSLKPPNKAFSLNAQREQNILKACKFVIGRTDWDHRVTRVLAPESQYFVGNEILRDGFYTAHNVWNKTDFGKPLQLVTTTSDVAYKGFELIVKTAKLLHDNGIDFVWNVVGLHTEGLMAKVVSSWLGLDFNEIGVILHGVKNEEELITILLDSDIYCQVSHIENSPNSICEAMILGMPVVATNVGGTASLVTDSKEGILVQEGEPFSLAGAIMELKNNFAKSKKMGEKARQRAMERHNPSKVVSEIVNAYKTIVKG